MTDAMNVELSLLQQYADEITSLTEQLADAHPDSAKQIHKQLDRKIEIYAKQVRLFQSAFPAAEPGKIYEASLYSFQALVKYNSVGFARRAALKNQSLALGLVARQQEKNNAEEALKLLDRAIATYDSGRPHFAKASIYHSFKRNSEALAELDQVVTRFHDDSEIYMLARRLKAEIETPEKKDRCFIATAAFGSSFAPEVLVLSHFRDDVLLASKPGRLFVRAYYFASPPLALLISRVPVFRAVARQVLIRPLVRMLPKGRTE